MSLNERQRAAADHLDGPALILAGPGTGKTTTLVGRCCRLLERGVPPRNILVSTFTKDAATQLVERVSARVGTDASAMRIGTFHSLCWRWLRDVRQLQEKLRIDAGWKPIASHKRVQLMRSLVGYSSGLGEPADVLESIDRLKGHLITDSDATRLAVKGSKAVSTELADAYGRYQEALRNARQVDFGDMILLAVRGFQDSDLVRRKLSERFRYVLIDEFQDVNAAQVALVDVLLDQHDNVWAVGDDDQAIYGWRGSDSRYTLDFATRHPGAQIIRLADNYRSQPPILTGATALIRTNTERMDKPLAPTRAGSRPIVVCTADNEHQEAHWIAAQVQAAAQQGCSYEDMAILVRISALMPPIEGALRAAGVPFVVRGQTFWERYPVRVLLDALHLHLYGAPSPVWRSGSVYYLEKLPARSESASLAQSVRTIANHLRNRLPSSMKSEQRVEWMGALDQVVTEAESFEDPALFFEHVQEQRDSRPAPSDDAERVVIATIHSAKGLEWAHVFLAGWDDGILPHAKSERLEEERRLAYVAMTRAKDQLCISTALERGRRPAAPSAFIDEFEGACGGQNVQRAWHPPELRVRALAAQTRSHGAKSPSMPFTQRPVVRRTKKQTFVGSKKETKRFREGDRVTHKKFGPGTVLAAGEADKVTVRFASGKRVLMGKFLQRR